MKESTLKKANELALKIKLIKKNIENVKVQKCEWIEFTFGNGSNRSTVCDDKNIITKIRDIINYENGLILESLEEEFNEL